MFTRLVVGIPKSAYESLQEAKPSEVWVVRPLNDSPIESCLPLEYMTVELSSGFAAAGLYKPTTKQCPTNEALIAEYRKKGWSEAKIIRALKSMEAKGTPRFIGLRQSIRDFIAELAHEFGSIYIYVYPTFGVITPKKTTTIAVPQLLRDSSAVKSRILIEIDPSQLC